METHTFTAVHPSDLPKTPAMPKAMLERRHEKGRQRRVDVLSRRLGTYTGSGVSKKKKKKKSKAKERERLRRSTANGHASSAMCNIYDEQGRHLTCWVGYFPDTCTHADLHTTFSELGVINRIELKHCFAFIEFKTHEACERAVITYTPGRKFLGKIVNANRYRHPSVRRLEDRLTESGHIVHGEKNVKAPRGRPLSSQNEVFAREMRMRGLQLEIERDVIKEGDGNGDSVVEVPRSPAFVRSLNRQYEGERLTPVTERESESERGEVGGVEVVRTSTPPQRALTSTTIDVGPESKRENSDLGNAGRGLVTYRELERSGGLESILAIVRDAAKAAGRGREQEMDRLAGRGDIHPRHERQLDAVMEYRDRELKRIPYGMRHERERVMRYLDREQEHEYPHPTYVDPRYAYHDARQGPRRSVGIPARLPSFHTEVSRESVMPSPRFERTRPAYYEAEYAYERREYEREREARLRYQREVSVYHPSPAYAQHEDLPRSHRDHGDEDFGTYADKDPEMAMRMDYARAQRARMMARETTGRRFAPPYAYDVQYPVRSVQGRPILGDPMPPHHRDHEYTVVLDRERRYPHAYQNDDHVPSVREVYPRRRMEYAEMVMETEDHEHRPVTVYEHEHDYVDCEYRECFEPRRKLSELGVDLSNKGEAVHGGVAHVWPKEHDKAY
ncbi:hypothetical protein G7K_3947-t1 [Saitoella complicata NRRL Y-17804]|uniref:RRM domain-containing protein n=1 Tax=Saitoella complicata (strain BCRC 22490 / CBS 7301 / JCM 7358 / NBRC 10748 / NRRL Y-17804) TaxID=698492 RepID=A0A0E9NIW1_SAICN|nr:hypothetical protein G7K_3947-t1 [Saitoella complicata NRRL Y-17804]